LFVFLGAGILGVLIHRYASEPGKEKLLGNLVYAAFILALVGEVMGRYLFYASYLRVGF
jgi:anaerobic dimethyl sulfoxide reductase subunit C (anchor subunit)